MRNLIPILAGVISLVAFLGCGGPDTGKDKKDKDKPKKVLTPEERREAGRKLVKKSGCLACHTFPQKDFPTEADNGPDLRKVGAKYVKLEGSEKAALKWLQDHLKDPEKFPGKNNEKYHSKMMSYRHLGDEKILNLAHYLLTLK